MNLEYIRSQFPALAMEEAGRSVTFFDNPAGTQVPRRVIDRVSDYWQTSNANHGGVFATSKRSDALVLQARDTAARFVNADGPDEIVFGPNMTSLTYSVSRAIGKELQPGDEVLVTALDHEANVSPWKTLAEQGAIVKYVDVNLNDCRLDMRDLENKLSARTRVVAVTHASNAVGTIPDMEQIGRLAHAAGAWFFVDAVHYAPHAMIDVEKIDCDLLVCSGYKFYAPHVGILYGKRELLRQLQPDRLTFSKDELPTRWENGAPSFEGIAGLLGAFEFIASIGGAELPSRSAFEGAFAAIRQHEGGLVQQLLDGLRQIEGVRVYGITEVDAVAERTPTVSLTVSGLKPRDVAVQLAERQIFTWFGHYGAATLIERLGLSPDGALRVGIASYNTRMEIDLLLEALASLRLE